ncbi:MAG TPA: lysylphosphatidylglycerol synthase domain-containing protein [Ramlibacter sp.]|nr:lysylphosphatidylglycerol synthase domain-containing protein [Ramlibacter sp.]
MNRSFAAACAGLLLLALSWLVLAADDLARVARSSELRGLLGLSLLYVVTHLLRMLRLALLTLDTRSLALAAMAAHGLTAFPSSFLPFKLGEVLRLAAFSRVYGSFRRALAVWLVERFSDVLVISTFILGLYVLEVEVPPAMRIVFILFVAASALGLLSVFAVSKVFMYLNRRLVLTSETPRGLALLRAGHALRQLDADIKRSVQGRFAGVLLLSLLIWGIELLTLLLFLRAQPAGGEASLPLLFVSALLASLPGGHVPGAEGFGLYQSLGLVMVCVGVLALIRGRTRARRRPQA